MNLSLFFKNFLRNYKDSAVSFVNKTEVLRNAETSTQIFVIPLWLLTYISFRIIGNNEIYNRLFSDFHIVDGKLFNLLILGFIEILILFFVLFFLILSFNNKLFFILLILLEKLFKININNLFIYIIISFLPIIIFVLLSIINYPLLKELQAIPYISGLWAHITAIIVWLLLFPLSYWYWRRNPF